MRADGMDAGFEGQGGAVQGFQAEAAGHIGGAAETLGAVDGQRPDCAHDGSAFLSREKPVNQVLLTIHKVTVLLAVVSAACAIFFLTE
jgi:hypothetical protein